MRTTVTLIALALTVGACERGPSPEMQAQLAELTALSAEKDSLIRQVAENSRLMSEIGVQLVAVADQEQLARVAMEAESPVAASRDSLRTMVADVTGRLQQLETRLAETGRRVRALNRTSDSARTAFEQAITDLRRPSRIRSPRLGSSPPGSRPSKSRMSSSPPRRPRSPTPSSSSKSRRTRRTTSSEPRTS